MKTSRSNMCDEIRKTRFYSDKQEAKTIDTMIDTVDAMSKYRIKVMR